MRSYALISIFNQLADVLYNVVTQFPHLVGDILLGRPELRAEPAHNKHKLPRLPAHSLHKLPDKIVLLFLPNFITFKRQNVHFAQESVNF